MKYASALWAQKALEDIMTAYTLWNDFDRFAESMLNNKVVPKLDVWEGKESYQVKVELPGFSKEEVGLQVQNGVLEIDAKASETAKDDGQWLVRERVLTNQARSLRLPRNVDPNGIQASFQDGLLILTLPKKPETQARSITIDAA